MRRHWHTVSLLILCGIGVLISSSVFLRDRHNITPKGCEQLGGALTLAEVEKVLGGPAGDYGPGKGQLYELPGGSVMGGRIRSQSRRQDWLAADFGISVWFDASGTVTAYSTMKVYRPWNSYKSLMLQTIGLQAPNPVPFWLLIK